MHIAIGCSIGNTGRFRDGGKGNAGHDGGRFSNRAPAEENMICSTPTPAPVIWRKDDLRRSRDVDSSPAEG